jgi:uncharacterized surface protein with fasciclin (FAS1) repeats
MQINSPRFIQRFMIGLIASSAGAFVALPSMAMPEVSEAAPAIAPTAAPEPLDSDAIEATEKLPAPAAEETLPTPEEALSEASEETAETAVSEPVEIKPAEASAPADEMADEMLEADVVETDAVESEAAGAEALEAAPVEAAETEMPAEDAVTADETEVLEETVEATETEMPAEDAVTADETEVMEEESLEAAEEMNTEEFTIAELTSSSDSFKVLAAALEAAGLTEVLSQEGPYTVFAPTDEAFAALPEGAVEQLLLPENKDVLTQILTYHVVPDSLLSTDMETGSIATVEGQEVAIEVAETVTVNNANVVVPDVAASNGVIHIIDRVILPPEPEADATTEETAEPVQ